MSKATNLSMRTFLVFVSLCCCLCGWTQTSSPESPQQQCMAAGDSLYPQKDSAVVKLQTMIEMQQGYISGICILSHKGDSIRGVIFNEFGITAMEFRYAISNDEVRLTAVLPMIDKWYIRSVIRKDLREVLHALRDGQTVWQDEKYKIKFKFTPLKDIDTDDEIEEPAFQDQ